jgi:hypothetical protein
VTTTFLLTARHATAERSFADVLTAEAREEARIEANAWIKRLRLVPYDGQSMRERFLYRGDSLWWFTEIYLHKIRPLDRAVETILALERLVADDEPQRITVRSDDEVVRQAARTFSVVRQQTVDVTGTTGLRAHRPTVQSFMVGASAVASRWRRRRAHVRASSGITAFIHSAFWRQDGSDDTGRESYVGPVLDAVRARVGSDGLTCVGVGPRRNFRTRRWWDPILGGNTSPAVVPIEQLASRDGLTDSLRLWSEREDLARAIVGGRAIREAGMWRGYDLWPVLSDALADAARVQWPWSARSMDEARAAIAALSPAVVVTYAEAGGWGRALMLEARRAGIPSVGLQHGFIYRHWLNYQHLADEMEPCGADLGFPRPDRTLVFDGYAKHTLIGPGHFPEEALAITGSPRLDELSSRFHATRLDAEARRQHLGVPPSARVVVVAAKESEIRNELPPLIAAIERAPTAYGVIKPHPAESPDVYASVAGGRARVHVTDARADLGEWLALADVMVTKNSTVAIDAMALGVPALVVGLPNNLSPFVEAGVMAGAEASDVGQALESVLYDAEGRAAMRARATAFLSRHGIASDGAAAGRAADAILTMTRHAATLPTIPSEDTIT